VTEANQRFSGSADVHPAANANQQAASADDVLPAANVINQAASIADAYLAADANNQADVDRASNVAINSIHVPSRLGNNNMIEYSNPRCCLVSLTKRVLFRLQRQMTMLDE
jgi:hypothetical protein